MKTVLYKSDDEESKRKFYQVLKELKPGSYAITIKINRPIRSLGANRYFHMVWNIYATHTGHYIDELKREFYEKIGFYEIFTDKRGISTKRYK